MCVCVLLCLELNWDSMYLNCLGFFCAGRRVDGKRNNRVFVGTGEEEGKGGKGFDITCP